MNEGVELRKTFNKGKGVFATKPFIKNQVIIKGVISVVLRHNSRLASQVAIGRYIIHEGLNNKVNHSCYPNCGVRVNETGAYDIIARRTILIDDEITIDYATRNYTINYFAEPCKCGTIKCRSIIKGWKEIGPGLRQIYIDRGLVAPYLLELK